jgi:hypothetical protein
MTKYRDLTEQEHAALEAFAKEFGRNKWREKLSMVYWYNARVWTGPVPGMGALLHGIRNDLGPTWLYDVYRPRKKAAEKHSTPPDAPKPDKRISP